MSAEHLSQTCPNHPEGGKDHRFVLCYCDLTAFQDRVRALEGLLEQAGAPNGLRSIDFSHQLTAEEIEYGKSLAGAARIKLLEAERDAAQKEAFDEHELRLKVADQRDAALMALEMCGDVFERIAKEVGLGQSVSAAQVNTMSGWAKEALANLKKGEV